MCCCELLRLDADLVPRLIEVVEVAQVEVVGAAMGLRVRQHPADRAQQPEVPLWRPNAGTADGLLTERGDQPILVGRDVARNADARVTDRWPAR